MPDADAPTKRRRKPAPDAPPPAARRRKSKAPPFVIVPKKGEPGAMLLDPMRSPEPPLTTDPKLARVFHGRASAHKFLKRHPGLARRFHYQRVD